MHTLKLAVPTVAVALATALTASAAPAGAAPLRASNSPRTAATLTTFAGTWYGHTRYVTITKKGFGTERIDSGCCDHEITFTFQLTKPTGNTAATASATERLLKIIYIHKPDFNKSFPAPHVGQVGQLRLKNGVPTDPFIKGLPFCDDAAGSRGVCGA